MPPHHNVDEFATALRAVGEPMRGLPVKDISVGQMLDGLFTITRDFDMQTQPHLLLLQKTMVMEEGVATALDPDINMWETAEPFLTRMGARRARARGARSPTGIVRDCPDAAQLPELIRRIDHYYPPPGAAPPDAAAARRGRCVAAAPATGRYRARPPCSRRAAGAGGDAAPMSERRCRASASS